VVPLNAENTIVAQAPGVGGPMAEMTCLSGRRIQLVQAAIRPHPQFSLMVFEQRLNVVAADRRSVVGIVKEFHKSVSREVQPIETVVRRNPNVPAAIFKQLPGAVAREAVGITGVCVPRGEGFRLAIEPVQSVLGADPQLAASIFNDITDGILAQAARIAGPMLEDDKPVTVIAGQTVVAAEPEKSATVLTDGLHRILRGASFAGHHFESDPVSLAERDVRAHGQEQNGH